MKPIICIVNSKHKLELRAEKALEFSSNRRFGEYRIYKLRSTFNLLDIKVKFQSEIIIDISDLSYQKNRYGNSNDISYAPDNLKRLLKPINAIMEGHDYKSLSEIYSMSNLVEAIFLTDTYSKFKENINEIEYQLIRFKYGKEVQENFLPELVERYPEKLI